MKYLLTRHFNQKEVEEADSCGNILAKLNDGGFSHLILDLQLGDCNSMDIIQDMLSRNPSLSVLVYTMSPESIYGKRLLQMGVLGFLSKQESEETVLRALNLFLLGRPYASEELKNTMQHEHNDKTGQAKNPFDDLSEREMAVFRYLLQGMRVKEISNRLDLKMSTVATYKVRIFEKLDVDNLADMQRLADVYHLG
jgi:DNA-binding NarL/FixJ family response regulator